MTNYNVIFDMLKGQYNFSADLKNNHCHEDWICKYLVDNKLFNTAELVDSQDKEKRKIYDIKTTGPEKTIEVKKDLFCYKSGNIFFETESRGNFSGIITTKSDNWCQSYFCKDGVMRTGIADVADVKETIFMPGYKKLAGGDKYKNGKAASGIIVPWKDYNAICFYKFEIDALDYIIAIGLLNEYNKRTIAKEDRKEDNAAW